MARMSKARAYPSPTLRRTERLAQVALQRTAAWGKAQPGDVASRKARAAWASLAQQPVLPAVLAVQVQGIAQRDLPVLDGVRQALR